MSTKRPYLDYPRNEAGLVDNFIGTAYDVVKGVYDALPELTDLYDQIEEIPTLAVNAVEAAMVPARVEIAELVSGAAVSAEQAAASAELAADNADRANAINVRYPFALIPGQGQYDVTVISGDPTATTASMALWVEGAIEYDFTINSPTVFTLNTLDALADTAQLAIILNARFSDVVKNLEDLEKSFEEQFQHFLDGTGYENPVAYTPGLLIQRSTQTVIYAGEVYAFKPEQLPFYSSNWGVDAPKAVFVGDTKLRTELADPNKGAKLVAGSLRRVGDTTVLGTAGGLFDGEVVYLAGYHPGWAAKARGATGSGEFFWKAGSTAPYNGGTRFPAPGGCWFRIYSDKLSVDDFGAAGDYGGIVASATDDTDAFTRAFANKAECSVYHLSKQGNYYVAPTNGFDMSNIALIGIKSYTQIVCGNNTSLFNVGERCTFRGLQIGFTNVSMGLGPTEKIVFNLIDSSVGPVAQFCTFEDIATNSLGCGTGFYTGVSGGSFNNTFKHIYLQNFSYAGINFNNTTRTGSTYDNIHMRSNKQPPRMLQLLGEEIGSVWGLLNLEQSVVTGPVFNVVNVDAFIATLHIEGIRMLGDFPLVQYENSCIEVASGSLFYPTFGSYVSGGAVQTTGFIKSVRNVINSPPYDVRDSFFKIRSFNAKGINYRYQAGYLDGLLPPELAFNWIYGSVVNAGGVKPITTIESWSRRTWILDSAKYTEFPCDETNCIVVKPMVSQTKLQLAGAWRTPANSTEVVFNYRYDPLMKRTKVVAEFNLTYQDKAVTTILTLPAHLNPADRKWFRAMLDGGAGQAMDIRVGYNTVTIFAVNALVGTGGALASSFYRVPVTLEYYV